MFHVESEGPRDFFILDEKGEALDATFYIRSLAEWVAIQLNRDEKQRIEAGQDKKAIRVVLGIDCPPPADVIGYTTSKTKIRLDGYGQKPKPQSRVKITL